MSNQSNGPAEFARQQQNSILTAVKKHLSYEIALMGFDLKLLAKQVNQDDVHSTIQVIIQTISEIDLNTEEHPECQFREVKFAPYSAMFDGVKHATANLKKDSNGFDINILYDVGISGAYINFINIRSLVALAYIDSIANVIIPCFDELLRSAVLLKPQQERIYKTQMKFSNMRLSSEAHGEITALHVALTYIMNDIRGGLVTENQVIETLEVLGVAQSFSNEVSVLYHLINLLAIEEQQQQAIESGKSEIPRAYNKERKINIPSTWFGVEQVELDDYLMPIHFEVQLRNSLSGSKKLSPKQMHAIVYKPADQSSS